jgi:inosine-uridine nucleoside N-ribohydrolase
VGVAISLGLLCLLSPRPLAIAQATPKELVIIDTDIGDDIDDAFALALALQSPELNILGITATYGQTHLRAQLLRRFLDATGHAAIPVAAGEETKHTGEMTQAPYAERGDKGEILPQPAAEFLLGQIRAHPDEITLIAIGPLVNVGAAIDRDPATFRKLKRVVMMGGSIYRGYDTKDGQVKKEPDPEWNILCDVTSAQKLLASGVPIFMMPLDSTELKLDSARREEIFRNGSPLTDQLTLLYHEWGQPTPTLFDPMAVAYAIRPSLCPVTPLHLSVDDKGYTRVTPGMPNVEACLRSDPKEFFDFMMPRLLSK